MKPIRAFATIAFVLLVSACAMQPAKRSLPVAVASACASATACAQEREDAVLGSNVWSLAGRIAVSNGRDGGSGRVEWAQDDEFFSVVFSAPITRQSWRLSMDQTGATLDGLKGGPRTGSDAAALVREATGWDIPVDAMTAWVRGIPAPDSAPTSVQYDAAGRLDHLEQAGWVIDYGWPDAPTTVPAMPTRVEAVRGAAKVRLVVDEWALDAPTP